ncbi:MAG TPA: ribonuclease H [Promineifilum sp.]|nr:ribonuclease H [Promineifilum sp.]HRQ12283.1 ribonuclease H [Promineifilum sp.]
MRVSCKGNPGPGTWAIVLESGDEWETLTGVEASTTNNRMELTAAIQGLQLLGAGSQVQIFTTSDYLYQGATQWVRGWQSRAWQKKDGQPVANADLWLALVAASARYTVEWVNAKGQHLEGLERAGRLLSVA